jgi:hypothetical protein
VTRKFATSPEMSVKSMSANLAWCISFPEFMLLLFNHHSRSADACTIQTQPTRFSGSVRGKSQGID